YYNMSEADLRKTAENDLQLFKRTGYRGSLTGFGSPFVDHGDTVKIIDSDFPEREGSYIVDDVKVSFSVGGFRREIQIGKALS
ncbi:MAG: hypothetical protein AAFW67_13570, partial [Cyanobacteria bacterium J06638_38]